MSRLGDYRSKMTRTRFTDEDFELLLRGEPRDLDLASLVPFVEALRDQIDFEPDRDDVDRIAMRTAAVVQSQFGAPRSATVLASHGPSSWRRLSRRATLVVGSLAAVVAMSGVGLAADGASPGDFLYGVDLALEKVGIGDGSTAERIEEADVLVERDDLSGAVALLGASISKAGPRDAASLAAATEALEKLVSGIDEAPGAASADVKEKVNDLLDFIGANVGKGNGLDGKEFGQGVAEIAGGRSAIGDDAGTESTPGPGDSEGPKSEGNGSKAASDGAPGDDGSADLPGNSGNSNAGGNGNGSSGSGQPPGNSGNSNAGGNGNASSGSGQPPGNSGNSNAGGNGKGGGTP